MAYNTYFSQFKPREAANGIKAQSKKGEFVVNWWGKRWIEAIKSFDSFGDMTSRLQRGRTYARSGQVLNIDIGSGKVKAEVQGSESRPYRIQIRLKVLTIVEEEKLVNALASDLGIASRLLAGDLPSEVEKKFSDIGVSLFPSDESDMETQCSCPDWSIPCKHAAAVYYLLGEEIDRDPFLLLTMRGVDRERLLSRLLLALHPDEVAVEPTEVAATTEQAIESATDPERFWHGTPFPIDLLEEIVAMPPSPPLLSRVGAFPFWRGEKPLDELLEPLYRTASLSGLNLLRGAGEWAASKKETTE